MDINIVFNVLTVFNVLALIYSMYLIKKIGFHNVKRIKTYLSIVFIFYLCGFLYVEGYFIKHGFVENSSTAVLVMSTISTQALVMTLWIIRRLLNHFLVIKKINHSYGILSSGNNKVTYTKSLSNKIELGVPFSFIKIKINNNKKLIDTSTDKVFGKVISHAVLILKKTLKNKHLDFFHDNREIIIISYSTSKDELINISTEMHEALMSPILMNAQHFLLQPIMGCVISTSKINTAEEIVKQADIACYKAKKLGLIIDFYRSTYTKSIHEEVEILNKLIYAIPNNEFELHYQPIVNSIDKTIHGYEALIRWPQEDGSMIPPDKFIKIAENNNYIKGITHWVINQVTHDIAGFKRENLHPQVHINVSTLDLHDDDLYDLLFSLVRSQKLKPSDVILEVTESALMTDVDSAYLMLSKLSELGFYISIDDFGTGYSSLSLLRILSFNQIKIDQSFIRNMSIGNSDYAIVASTIYLAHSLGCNVVAEGVEDTELFDELKELGCDYIQGYYISKPKEFIKMVHWSLKQVEREKQLVIA
ncbi:EAL domain-containing protein [Aliivibrio logei]|uniref:EAL domain-containing protein n=1 Tax=Aliivibrio logei TaxID=688 RepID=UPI0035C91127